MYFLFSPSLNMKCLLLFLKALPLVLSQVLRQDKYQDLGPQFAEWMIELSTKHVEHVSKFHRKIIQESLFSVKFCEGYTESSAWGRLTMMI